MLTHCLPFSANPPSTLPTLVPMLQPVLRIRLPRICYQIVFQVGVVGAVLLPQRASSDPGCRRIRHLAAPLSAGQAEQFQVERVSARTRAQVMVPRSLWTPVYAAPFVDGDSASPISAGPVLWRSIYPDMAVCWSLLMEQADSKYCQPVWTRVAIENGFHV